MGIRFTFLEGKVFNRINVIEHVGFGRYLCVCSCGKRIITAGARLRSGQTESCGCLRAELKIMRATKHGLTGTAEHRAWAAMKSRCTNPAHPYFKHYGGRGIRVCERWNDFSMFFSDMGRRPSRSHSIDRINNNEGYSPENCRWATAVEQHRNTRAVVMLEHNGVSKPLCVWAEDNGLSTAALKYRIKAGWDVDRALKKPPGRWVK